MSKLEVKSQHFSDDGSVGKEGGFSGVLGLVTSLFQSRWAPWVGMRYLRSKKNSRFLSFISILSVVGVGLGVTAMIVVLSVMDGFETQLKKRLTSADLHVLITPTQEIEQFDMGVVPEATLPQKKIDQWTEDFNLVGAWSVLSTEAILKFGSKVTGAVIKGVDEARLQRLQSQIVEKAENTLMMQGADGGGRIRMAGLFLGQELANSLGVIPGDQVTIVSPTETDGPMQAIPRTKRFVVEGIYRSGVPEQELHVVFTKIKNVRSFLRKQDVLSSWEIAAQSLDDAPQIAERIKKDAPGFRVQTWMELNAHLFASLKLERISMFVILAFIVIVASFNIVTTLTLMVLEKRREISILKAMGARDHEVGAIFLAEGLLIGGVGILAGNVLGFLLCSSLSRWEFIQLPDVYYDTSLPVTFNGLYYLIISLAASVIVLAACLYPAKRATALDPLDGIRFG